MLCEQEPMKMLTKKKQLSAYFHGGFWHQWIQKEIKNI